MSACLLFQPKHATLTLQCAASCRTKMTRLTGLDKKDEHHLLVQDLLVIIPVEMVRLYFETVSKEEPLCCCCYVVFRFVFFRFSAVVLVWMVFQNPFTGTSIHVHSPNDTRHVNCLIATLGFVLLNFFSNKKSFVIFRSKNEINKVIIHGEKKLSKWVSSIP